MVILASHQSKFSRFQLTLNQTSGIFWGHPLYVHYMFTICSPYVHYRKITCSNLYFDQLKLLFHLPVIEVFWDTCYMFTICSPYVQYRKVTYSNLYFDQLKLLFYLPVIEVFWDTRYMFTICSLYVHHMFSIGK